MVIKQSPWETRHTLFVRPDESANSSSNRVTGELVHDILNKITLQEAKVHQIGVFRPSDATSQALSILAECKGTIRMSITDTTLVNSGKVLPQRSTDLADVENTNSTSLNTLNGPT